LQELIMVFLADAPQLIARIDRAIRRGDAVELKDAAHALKGCAGNFDPGRTFEAARQLEFVGRDNRLAEAPAAFSAVKNDVARLIRSLKYVLKNGEGGAHPNS